MNINKANISTTEAINARKVSLATLEEALKKKINELREICLKERDITGQLPVEYPLQPREPLPQARRSIELELPKEFPRRTTSTSKHTTNITLNKISSSKSSIQKHSTSHATKLENCLPSPLGECNQSSKLGDMQHQILKIQSNHDPNKRPTIEKNNTRSDGNFSGIGPSPNEGMKFYGSKLESAHARNHSESSINQVEKSKLRQNHASISRSNREFLASTRNGHYPRSDVSSISIKTMIQPSNNTQAPILRNNDAGKSKMTFNQASLQSTSVRLENLQKEIKKLQASQSSQTSMGRNSVQSSKSSNSGKFGSLDSEIDTLFRSSEIKHHQRIVSDGNGYMNHLSQNGSGVLQSNDFAVCKSNAHCSSDQSFNVTEIPAESNRGSSPTISSTDSTSDENSNPLTTKISQLSITGVGNFQPYWEETKPYELSDFYKYSAKHRTGGRILKKNNISERIENLEQTIAAKSNKFPNQGVKDLFRKNVASETSDNNNRNVMINSNANNRIHNAQAQKTMNTKLSGPSHPPSSIHDHHFIEEQQSATSNLTLAGMRYV